MIKSPKSIIRILLYSYVIHRRYKWNIMISRWLYIFIVECHKFTCHINICEISHDFSWLFHVFFVMTSYVHSSYTSRSHVALRSICHSATDILLFSLLLTHTLYWSPLEHSLSPLIHLYLFIQLIIQLVSIITFFYWDFPVGDISYSYFRQRFRQSKTKCFFLSR